MKEVKIAAKKERVQFSQEEVRLLSAGAIASTIDNDKMGIAFEKVDFDAFLKYFKEKANEMFETQDYLLLSIGPAINTDGDGVFSNDMQTILNYIEEKMQTKFYFHYGILLWVGKNNIAANWLPH